MRTCVHAQTGFDANLYTILWPNPNPKGKKELQL